MQKKPQQPHSNNDDLLTVGKTGGTALLVVIKDWSSETCDMSWVCMNVSKVYTCRVCLLTIGSSVPVVPPDADVILEVCLLSAVDAPDLELLPPSEKISLASKKREKGNVHYQRGDYAFAVNSYGIALHITEASSKGKKTGHLLWPCPGAES